MVLNVLKKAYGDLRNKEYMRSTFEVHGKYTITDLLMILNIFPKMPPCNKKVKSIFQ